MCNTGNYAKYGAHSRFSGPVKFRMACGPRMRWWPGLYSHGYIPYNMEDLGEEYLITVPLVGRSKEEVSVSLINNILNVSATKPKSERDAVKESEEEKKKERVYQRKYYSFVDVNMDITLPRDADIESVSSKMSKGLLEIRMRKIPGKNIDITENN